MLAGQGGGGPWLFWRPPTWPDRFALPRLAFVAGLPALFRDGFPPGGRGLRIATVTVPDGRPGRAPLPFSGLACRSAHLGLQEPRTLGQTPFSRLMFWLAGRICHAKEGTLGIDGWALMGTQSGGLARRHGPKMKMIYGQELCEGGRRPSFLAFLS